MPSSTRRKSTSHTTSSRDSRSRGSYDSYGSQSTTPTSLYTSPRPSDVEASRSSAAKAQRSYEKCDQNLSPATSCYQRASVETYASTTASELDLTDSPSSSSDYEHQDIPPLPTYRREIVDANVRPSTPRDFAKLFPSLNRVSIRHDEFTPDGNMNLRVDTPVPGRKKQTMQLFHLRMYDLGRREFSLRRYCRDSGREVCNSKRKVDEPVFESRPTLQRSMTSAIKTLGGKPAFGRTNSGASIFSASPKRSGTSHSSSSDASDDFARAFGRGPAGDKKARPAPTDTIKLEFSNYARVDVQRRGDKRYEFQWWGHKYSWKRVTDKHLDTVSFHLLRDGKETPIAHIVPETRSPTQVRADEKAAGWVPPCHMWISDQKIVDAVTDVADVIMATGLMALVDDCIRTRWQTKKIHRIPLPLTARTVDFEYVGPKAFVQHFLGRRNTTDYHGSPRYGTPISAH